jgi:lysozyme family protein
MADFEKFIPHVLKWEGGYGDYKEDPGGCTNRGITIDTWRRFGYDKTGDGVITCEDVALITEADAKAIYKKWFWEANGGHLIHNQKVAEIIIDWVVNSGAGIAIVRVQRILNSMGNNLVTDGIAGIKTITAINKANQSELYKKIWQERERFYRNLVLARPQMKIFLQGWLNRLNSFPKEI